MVHLRLPGTNTIYDNRFHNQGYLHGDFVIQTSKTDTHMDISREAGPKRARKIYKSRSTTVGAAAARLCAICMNACTIDGDATIAGRSAFICVMMSGTWASHGFKRDHLN